MNNFFTVNELAKYFGVSAKTIYRSLWARGILADKVGARWRIAKSNRLIEFWISAYLWLHNQL